MTTLWKCIELGGDAFALTPLGQAEHHCCQYPSSDLMSQLDALHAGWSMQGASIVLSHGHAGCQG